MTKPRNQHIIIRPSEAKFKPPTEQEKEDNTRRMKIRHDLEEKRELEADNLDWEE